MYPVRSDVDALRQVRINVPAGGDVLFGDVADIRIAPMPNVVQREDASRRIDVTCDIGSGYDLGSVAREIENRVSALSFDRGYHPEFLGEYAARQESRRRLLAMSAVALLGIILLLYTDFRLPRLVLLVLASLPFALVGGVMASFLTGGVLSLGSLVGFVTVLGIAARNGIMLVSHYPAPGERGGPGIRQRAVLRGSEERLAPILMAALATGLALLPIVLGGDRPPALYLRFGRKR